MADTSTSQNVQIVLASRPHGAPTAENFRTETVPLPSPGEDEVLLRTVYLSLDPYMRGRLSEAESYATSWDVDAPLQGGTVSEVLQSRSDRFAPGDLVLGYTTWSTHAVARAPELRKVASDDLPPSTALGVLGMPGFTAYAGLTVIGRPQPGETVVVAAASGPVGSMVGQLAQRAGARAVGVAGGPDKCAWLTEIGFDAAVDHRSPTFVDDLAAATPGGIDVYFENVGGAVWDAVLRRLNTYARVPVCGLVAGYNATSAPQGPDRSAALMARVLTKSLQIRGFIQDEFVADHYKDFQTTVRPLVADGTIAYREDVVQGLDAAPAALIGLLEGTNFGKLVVQVGDLPA
jgi:NADPH2:quinone reductase